MTQAASSSSKPSPKPDLTQAINSSESLLNFSWASTPCQKYTATYRFAISVPPWVSLSPLPLRFSGSGRPGPDLLDILHARRGHVDLVAAVGAGVRHLGAGHRVPVEV